MATGSKRSNYYNKETLQAQLYDRKFILNGPVIKVYQNSDESFSGGLAKQRLSHIMDFPIIKSYDNQPLNPSNLTLFDNENKLGFIDEKQRDKVYMFDLEKGKVIQ